MKFLGNSLLRNLGKLSVGHQSKPEPIRAELSGEKFEHRAPAPQNAIDIFSNRWASDLSDVVPGVSSGRTRHFGADPRPVFAFNHVRPDVVAHGARILELGPLEAGHTYQFERLGAAEIITVEANVEAYLKCLIVKELIGLKRARFLLGDIVQYLLQDTSRYDLIFCCGVLYHMVDPIELVRLMAAHTDLISVWSHYQITEGQSDRMAETVERDGETYTYYPRVYGGRAGGTFWGGNTPTACLLSRGDLFRAFHHYGLRHHEIHAEDVNHIGGPCITVTFWR
jgi:hypothetical protein